MKVRNEKIQTQLIHMENKQKLEMSALEIKFDRIYKEHDSIRKH